MLELKKCKTKYVAFLDSDDIWHKNKLKLQLKIMKQNQVTDFSRHIMLLTKQEKNCL